MPDISARQPINNYIDLLNQMGLPNETHEGRCPKAIAKAAREPRDGCTLFLGSFDSEPRWAAWLPRRGRFPRRTASG